MSRSFARNTGTRTDGAYKDGNIEKSLSSTITSGSNSLSWHEAPFIGPNQTLVAIDDDGLSFFVTASDSIHYLINALPISPGGFETPAAAISWAKSNDVIVLDDFGNNVITEGLVLYLDSSNLASYPLQGSTWYDLSGNNNNTTISKGVLNNDHLISEGSSPSQLVCITPHSTTLNNAFTVTSGGWTIEELIRVDDITYPEAPAGTVVSDRAYGSTVTGFDWNHGNSMGLTYIRMGASSNNVSDGGTSYDVQNDITIDADLRVYGKWLSRTLYWDRDNDVMGAYINGRHQGNINISSLSGNALYDGSGIRWGELYGWQHDGARAKMRIYDKVLTQAEVNQNYYGGPIVTDSLLLAVDASNLVSYQSGSTTAYSLTGSNETNMYNGPYYVSEYNGGIKRDTTNDFISSSVSVGSTTTSFSVEVWFKANPGGSYDALISAWSNGAGGWEFQFLNGNLGVHPTYTVSYTSGEVVHAVYTQQGTTARIYLDGELKQTSTLGTTLRDGYIGIGNLSADGVSSAYNLDSTFYLYRIYKKTLSADEVKQNYNAQRARFGK